MATAPMMDMPPEAPAAESKTICISQQADGSFSVYEEGAEAMEMPGEMPAEEGAQGQTAASIDEALDLARSMLEGPETEQMSVEKAFQGGFKGDSVGPGY